MRGIQMDKLLQALEEASTKLAGVSPYIAAGVAVVQLVQTLLAQMSADGRTEPTDEEASQLKEALSQRASAEADFQSLIGG